MRRAVIAVVVAALAAGIAAPAVAAGAPAPRQASNIDVRRTLTYKEVGGTKLKLDA